MKKLLAILLMCAPLAAQTCTPSASQTCTPNISLALPVRNSQSWDTALNSNFTRIDALLSGFTTTNSTNPCVLSGVAYVGTGSSACWGSVDISAQINAAAATIGSSGGTIRVKAGTYATSTPVSITQNNINILGDGSVVTQVTYSGTGAWLSIFPSTFSVNSGSKVSGLSILSGNQGISQFGIKFTDLIGLMLDDIQIMNFSGTGSAGIWGSASTHWSERHVYHNVILGNDTSGLLIDFSAGTLGCITTFGYGTYQLWLNEGTTQTGINIQCGEMNWSNVFAINNMSGTSPILLTVANASQFANNVVNFHQEGGTSPVRFNVQGASLATMTGIVQNESEVTDTISSNSTVAVSYQNDAKQWEWRTTSSGTTNEFLLDTQANMFSTNGAQHNFQEGAARSAIAGYDSCYGDSSTHTLKCSYNNGTFYSVPLVGIANTWTATQTLNNPPVAGGSLSVAGTGACATVTTTAGGSWAGTFKCTGTTGASTITITPGITAPNGFICSVFDETTRANLAQQTSHNATTCVLTSTSITQNDVFVFQATAF